MSLSDALSKIAEKQSVRARVGILENKTYPDGTGVAEVGFWNEYGTIKIPPRSFFRHAVANNRNKLPQMMGSLLQKHDAETAMKLLCEHMVDELRFSVVTWEDPPNKQSTVKSKGFNAPLRGKERLLRNSFSYEINPDD